MGFPDKIISAIDFSFFSKQFVTHAIFWLVAAFTALLSLVLFFHWRKYGQGGGVLAVTELIYLGVSILLLTTAYFAL